MNAKKLKRLVAAFICVITALALARGGEWTCVYKSLASANFMQGITGGQQPQLFDRFGDVALKDEKILLDNLAKDRKSVV